MAFTTWTALKQKMLNDLAAGSTTLGEYDVDGVRMKYRSHEEWMRLFEMVEQKAAAESGAAAGRTYAKNGGGRWQ